MAHTPTPWAIDGDDRERIYIRPEGTGWLLAIIPRDLFMASVKPEWDVDDNAAFIVKAANCHSEMLAALKRLVEYSECSVNDSDIWNAARAAIAKAEA